MNGSGPFDLQAGEFLALYAVLFVAAILAGFAITAFARPEGNAAAVGKDDELALLAGGRARLAETVLARMLAAGQARIEKARIHLAPANTATTALEREVLALPSPASFGKVQRILKDSTARIERDLISRGLLMERGEAWRLGLLAALPLLAVLALGAVRFASGLATESSRAFIFLIPLLIATAIAALIRLFAVDRRTKGGRAVVKEARACSARLKKAPTLAETGTAVALFGTAVLAGSPLAGLYRMRQSEGGGGGGCGGGGCGGS